MTFLYFNTLSTKIEVHINSFTSLGRNKPLLFPQHDKVEHGPSKTSITKIWTDKKEVIKGNLYRYLTKLRRRGRPYSRHGAKYGTGEDENSLHNYKPSNKRDKG